MKIAEENLARLFERALGKKACSVNRLPVSGSCRNYFRITAGTDSCIGVYHDDPEENRAFLSFTRTFLKLGLPVPGILGEDPERHCYLLTDLGDITLFRHLVSMRKDKVAFPAEIIPLYRKALKTLPGFQVLAADRIDYRHCLPRSTFDRQSMRWDLNYFKYYFLKLAKIPFHEQALEKDFTALTSFLLQAPSGFFMYRDFQSRNIMLHRDQLLFIDYQGGRRGALPYDVASLLYDAKADLPEEVRSGLLNYYLDQLETYLPGQRESFIRFYPGFVLIRILQALGAYGFRGYYERKSHFLLSIPFALRNLRILEDRWNDLAGVPRLKALWTAISRIQVAWESLPADPASTGLTVTISSFSFHGDFPVDLSGHGGGYVFDCRSLPNPGRNEEFQHLTGKDPAVISFLEKEPEVSDFLQHVYELVGQSVRTYLKREFTHLWVAFGCTGGRHRSVYCAEMLSGYLSTRYNVKTRLTHHTLG